LKEKGVPVGKLERGNNNQIVLEVSGTKEKWETLLAQNYPILRELSSSEEGGIWRLVLVLDSKEAEYTKKRAIDQALEIIRNRVDQFGVSERRLPSRARIES
jgi:preprotein translocase subunit SecD